MIVPLAPRIRIAAALRCDPSGIAIQRMRQRYRIDGAQQMQQRREIFGRPAIACSMALIARKLGNSGMRFCCCWVRSSSPCACWASRSSR
jgi:hypothetical protein